MKNKIFIAVFTTILWVKQAQPAEPIFVNRKITDGGPADDAGRSG